LALFGPDLHGGGDYVRESFAYGGREVEPMLNDISQIGIKHRICALRIGHDMSRKELGDGHLKNSR